jgi:hypothetical protein
LVLPLTALPDISPTTCSTATGRAGFRQTCREAAGPAAMLRSLVGFW